MTNEQAEKDVSDFEDALEDWLASQNVSVNTAAIAMMRSLGDQLAMMKMEKRLTLLGAYTAVLYGHAKAQD